MHFFLFFLASTIAAGLLAGATQALVVDLGNAEGSEGVLVGYMREMVRDIGCVGGENGHRCGYFYVSRGTMGLY